MVIHPTYAHPKVDVYDLMRILLRLIKTHAEGRLGSWDPMVGRAMHADPLYMRIRIWQVYELSSDEVVERILATLTSYRTLYQPQWQLLVL